MVIDILILSNCIRNFPGHHPFFVGGVDAHFHTSCREQSTNYTIIPWRLFHNMFLEYENKQPDKMQRRNCSSVHPTSLAPPATLGSSGPQTLEVRFPRLLYFSTYTHFISKRTHQTTRARGPRARQFKLAQAVGITTCVLLWIGSPPVGDLRLSPYEFKKRRAIQ